MLATSCRRRGVLAALVVLVIAALAPAVAHAHSGTAPGAPGAKAWWTPADKDGFGTAASLDSKLWHTLEDGELTEVYYPDLGTPSIRDMQLVVTDGYVHAC
jgi:glucoamylase